MVRVCFIYGASHRAPFIASYVAFVCDKGSSEHDKDLIRWAYGPEN